MRPTTVLRRLPLFWKLLVPYVGLLLVVGTAGAFLITRDLSSRAQATLNDQLLQASLRARAHLQQAELSLLESANFAANLEGMREAIRERDTASTSRLLRSVLALKDELSHVIVTDAEGLGLVEYARAQSAGTPVLRAPADQRALVFVRGTLVDPAGKKKAELIRLDGKDVLAIAAPVCSGADSCGAVGATVVAVRLDALATGAFGRPSSGAGVRILDPSGEVLAGAGSVPNHPADVTVTGDRTVRRTETTGGGEASTLYATFEVQGRTVGMVAVTLPTEPAFASVRGAAIRLVAILVAALGGVIAVGALLSRFMVRQTRELLATHRALGQGDLSARAPVVSDDEIGELARGLNQMADQLQAGYETLEMRVGERTEEIQRLLRERTEFFASLSHELRTPIALIISFGDMLVDPDFSQTRRVVKERGAIIGDTGRQLLAVVNDILDLARLESGRVHVDLAALGIADLIDELRPTIAGLASAAEIALEIDVPEIPPVRADRQRMRQVILNLVDNAVKYTPSGGSVRITAEPGESNAHILVADTGVGIPHEARARLFEPFYRVPGNEPRQGRFSTGLGLAIAKRLIDAQSGDISLESAEGEGTTFTITLPLFDSRVVGLDDLRGSGDMRARRAHADDRRRSTRGRAS